MKIFKKKNLSTPSSEVKLNTIIELIKDLPRADYNRLREGMELIYNGYQKIKNAKTADEKENSEIENIEIALEKAK